MILRFACLFPSLALLVTSVAIADAPGSPTGTAAESGAPSVKLAVLRSNVKETVAEAKQVSYSHGGGCKQCACCPRCQEKCFVDISKEDVKKHAWDIECKKICIPRVSFPWQLCKSSHRCPGCGKSCCDRDEVCSCGCPQPAKGAKVRTVRELVKHEYTCKKCKYTWTVKTVGCGHCGGGNCSGDCVSSDTSNASNLAKQESTKPSQSAQLLRTKHTNSTLIPRGERLPPLPR